MASKINSLNDLGVQIRGGILMHKYGINSFQLKEVWFLPAHIREGANQMEKVSQDSMPIIHNHYYSTSKVYLTYNNKIRGPH